MPPVLGGGGGLTRGTCGGLPFKVVGLGGGGVQLGGAEAGHPVHVATHHPQICRAALFTPFCCHNATRLGLSCLLLAAMSTQS